MVETTQHRLDFSDGKPNSINVNVPVKIRITLPDGGVISTILTNSITFTPGPHRTCDCDLEIDILPELMPSGPVLVSDES